MSPTARAGLTAAVAAVFLFAGVAGVVFVAARGNPGRPAAVARGVSPPPVAGGASAKSEGESWTHRELFDYLRRRGVGVEEFSTHAGGFYGPAMVCVENPTEWERAALREDASDLTLIRAPVYVQKLKSATEARDDAGATKGGFAWGRFVFTGNRQLVDRIRAALGG